MVLQNNISKLKNFTPHNVNGMTLKKMHFELISKRIHCRIIPLNVYIEIVGKITTYINIEMRYIKADANYYEFK